MALVRKMNWNLGTVPRAPTIIGILTPRLMIETGELRRVLGTRRDLLSFRLIWYISFLHVSLFLSP